VATNFDSVTKKDAAVVGVIVALSVAAQALAAAYFEAKGSLIALGGSVLLFLLWVLVRFWPRS
jgi:hypothetical protein